MDDINKLLRDKKKASVKEVWRRMRKNKLAMIGLTIIIFFALVAIFADFIADYQGQALAMTYQPLQSPSADNWFGTDHLGRDVFARIVHGARISLSLGLITTAISLTFGCILGAIAGYFGGIVDNIIMRIIDMMLCIPGMLLALALIAALGTSIFNLLFAITLASVPGFTRIIRSVILTVVEQEYIEAAQSCGMSDFSIILRHVIPNAIGPIIVEATMSVSNMIITISSLSFLGMGIQPPQPEWGAMLSDARAFIRNEQYLVLIPGLCIVISALSLNLLGDGLRDALDPRLKD